VKNLWKVEVDPQSLRWIAGPERLTTGAGPDLDVAISPDGRKLAFTSRMILPDVGVMEMALAPDCVVLPIMEVSGGIWILENVGR
jgi:Tol biopolymer transport system component